MIYALSSGLEAILVVIVISIVIALLALLIRGVIKGFKKAGLEKYLLFDGVFSANSFKKLLKKEIKQSKKENTFSLIYLQVDKFTNLEASLNPQVLRQVLEELVKRIQNNMPYEMAMAVFKKGGFYFYLEEGFAFDEVMRYCYDLINVLRDDYLVGKKSTINVEVSLAVSFFPFHGDTINKLYRSLDLLMKEIVYDGGDTVRANALDEKMTQREYLDYFQQIKMGILNKEFEFYYQPSVNIVTNEVFSLRAYIRWNHPELGVLPAHKFIKVLEQSGDIYPIALHGLEIIIKEMHYLKKAFNNENLYVLNYLGNKELSNPNIIKDCTSILRKNGANPKNIIFEISEANLLKKDDDIITKNINALKRLGFKIAADTFGLTPFDLEKMGPTKLDLLKLNRLFLEETDLEARNVYIKMIVDFAKRNNLFVLAEQIENKKESEIFKELAITNQQGYYYAKALALNEVELWYQTYSAKANNNKEKAVSLETKEKE